MVSLHIGIATFCDIYRPRPLRQPDLLLRGCLSALTFQKGDPARRRDSIWISDPNQLKSTGSRSAHNRAEVRQLLIFEGVSVMRNTLLRADNATASVETIVPAKIRDLLGKPSLLETEDPKQYDDLVVELVRDVKPNDILEWLWLNDVAELTWDILRYRRIKGAYAAHAPHIDERYVDPSDQRRFLEQSFEQIVVPLDALERILTSVETRRNNALREIERRRAALGQALRQSSDQIIECEVPLVPSGAE
jgi:hypothetical protein